MRRPDDIFDSIEANLTQEAVADALASKSTVTVLLQDGRNQTGTLRRSALADTLYVASEGTNKTIFFHPDDVERVIFE